jgi:hypothetical protein
MNTLHTEHAHNKATWKESIFATLHCLTGCAIGEVLGMIIGISLGLSNLLTVILSIALAFLFGYALTIRSVVKSGIVFSAALTVAFAADTISITVMEIVDNAIMLAIPKAMDSGVSNPVFWLSLIFALGVAFIVTVPINKFLMGRGLGHAKIHQFHGV